MRQVALVAAFAVDSAIRVKTPAAKARVKVRIGGLLIDES